MDTDVDAIKSIYKLLLKHYGQVMDCERRENFIDITIGVPDDPKKNSLADHDHIVFDFELSLDSNGLVCRYPVEQEMWPHP